MCFGWQRKSRTRKATGQRRKVSLPSCVAGIRHPPSMQPMSVEHSMSDACVNESMSPNEDGQTGPNRQSISPGALLAACRQERGWTVEQVASQLNLAPRQIAALESDDYSALPGMAIVRGFIRAYAKLLKIDPSPMLAALGGETVFLGDSIAPRKTLSTPFAAARLPTMTERSGLSSKWLFLVLLL